jgi:predicted Zn-dependent protease with MMP-like domain
MFCPNKSHPDYKRIENVIGEKSTFTLWNKLEGRINLDRDAHFKSLMFKHEQNETLAILDWIDKYLPRHYRKTKFTNEAYDKIANDLKSIFEKQGINVDVVQDYNIEDSGFVKQISKDKFKITVNPLNMKEDTLFHEFGHIFVDLLGYDNPLIQSAINIAKQSSIYSKIEALYKDKYGDKIPLSDRRKLIDKEVLTTLMTEKVSSLYRDKTIFARWQSIVRAIFDSIKSLFGIKNDNVIQDLATRMLFNPFAINRLNRDFSDYVQYQVNEKKHKSISDFVFTLQKANLKLTNFTNGVQSILDNPIQNEVEKIKNFQYKTKNIDIQDVLENGIPIRTAKDIIKWINDYTSSFGQVLRIMNTELNADSQDSRSLNDLNQEYEIKLFDNIRIARDAVSSFDQFYSELNSKIKDVIQNIDEVTDNPILKEEFLDNANKLKGILQSHRILKENLNKKIKQIEPKLINILLKQYAANPELKNLLDKNSDIVKAIESGAFKLLNDTTPQRWLNSVSGSDNIFLSTIGKIYDTEQIKYSNKATTLLNNFENALKAMKSKGYSTNDIIDSDKNIVTKYKLKEFWKRWALIENKKERREFMDTHIKTDANFNDNVDKIKIKYKNREAIDNEIFDFEKQNTEVFNAYRSEFELDLKEIDARLAFNKTNGKFEIYPVITIDTEFKTTEFINDKYQEIQNNPIKKAYYDAVVDILKSTGIQELSKSKYLTIPFINIEESTSEKVFEDEEIDKILIDANGVMVSNIGVLYSAKLEILPYIKIKKELKTIVESKTSSDTERELALKEILQNIENNRDKLKIDKKIVFKSLEDIKNYNKEVSKTNAEYHKKNVNTDLEVVIPRALEASVKNTFKRNTLSKILFLRNTLNTLQVKGNKSYQNTISHADDFLKMVFYEQFKHDPNSLSTKIMDFHVAYMAKIGMGLNIHSAIKNVITGMNQNFIEGGGVHYSAKDLSKSSAYLLRTLPSFIADYRLDRMKSTTKFGAIAKAFVIFQSIRDMADGANSQGKSAMKWQQIVDNVLFLLQDKTEFYIQHTMYHAMLNSYRVVNGKIMNFEKFKEDSGLSQQSLLTTEEKKTIQVQYINQGKTAKEAKSEIDRIDNQRKLENSKTLKEYKEKTKELEKEFREKYKSVYDSIGYENQEATFNEVSKDEMVRFVSIVRGVNQSNQGIYNVEQKGAIEKYALARMAMQFRHWALPMWDKRFGKRFFTETFDEQTETYQKGMYHSVIDILGFKGIKKAIEEYNNAPDEFKKQQNLASLIITEFKNHYMNFLINYDNLSEVDKRNTKKVLYDLLLLALFSVLYRIFKGIGDDDPEKVKNSFLLQMTIYQFDAISTELAVMQPLFGMKGEAAKIIRTPMATMTLMQNYTNFLYYGLGYPFMVDERTIFKTGQNRGEYKALVYGMKSIPGLSQAYRVYNMDKNYQFYRLQKKPFDFLDDFWSADRSQDITRR